MKPDLTKLTMTVPEAGRVLGIGRSQAYEAVRRGDIPTIKIGRRILVPVAALERLLGARAMSYWYLIGAWRARWCRPAPPTPITTASTIPATAPIKPPSTKS